MNNSNEMIKITDIEALNKKIDKLMVEKTKADAQSEVWSNRLNDSIKEYASLYGVDISGSSLKEIKQKLRDEVKAVEEETRKEYEQAKKIVSLIEEGDFKSVRELLGEVVEEEEIAVENTPSTPIQEEKVELESAKKVVEEINDDAFYGVFSEDEENESPSNTIEVDESEEEQGPPLGLNNKAVPKNPFSGKPLFVFEDDDDDDEDEFINHSSTETSKNTIEKENNSPKFVVEDIEEDDGLGGFGELVKGSKFKL